ncbi:MAG: formate dehydrogenase accessory sulfurtransferase FdhD [Chloroflexales bacterium]|nr:formate dehydrogenase accessory sulfurtransferase FdhD [Chloroflexales bacterium]
MRPGAKTKTKVWTVEGEQLRVRPDNLATEEPLEIRLLAGGIRRTIAVTMRTPGADFELAAGFLFSEGIISNRQDIHRITYCVDADLGVEQRYNIVNVELSHTALPDLANFDRHFAINSACGVCGKASLEALQIQGCSPLRPGPAIDPQLLYSLPDRLRTEQSLFAITGGLHAAALFDLTEKSNAVAPLQVLREDIGRHNAVDKLIGWALLNQQSPLNHYVMLISGRAGFEIMQKALMAGIPIVCAVSAPSSLAVQLAREFGITLVGFLRGERFNVYAGIERLNGLHPDHP